MGGETGGHLSKVVSSCVLASSTQLTWQKNELWNQRFMAPWEEVEVCYR